MLGQAPPDRDHLAMRGRIAGGASEVAPAGNNRAVPLDHGTEWEVALPRFLDRHAHESDIHVGSRARQLRQGRRRDER
jgi:hypothetical protein